MEHQIWIKTLHITRHLPPTGWNTTRNKKELFHLWLNRATYRSSIQHSNLFVLGDINIHLNKLEDTDTRALWDITQHIKFPTHNCGHSLDIIATENRQNRNVTTIPGPYISDHQLIAVQLEDKRKPWNRANEIEHRRMMDETIQEVKDKFNNQPILDAEHLRIQSID